MARLNPKRRAQLAALKWSIDRNPTTQAETGHVRSIWNDSAKVHRMQEQRYKPDRMRPLTSVIGRIQDGRVVTKSGTERWSKS